MLANRENVKIVEDSSFFENEEDIEKRVVKNLQLEYLRPIENVFE